MSLARLGIGKVRETWVAPSDETELLVVATDRVSAFDVVLPQLIPDKGRLLTAIAAAAFERVGSDVTTHLLEVATDVPEAWLGRTLRVRRLEMLPVECVVRGRLVGSAWESYQRDGTAFGRALPRDLTFGAAFPEPLFTPTTKAHVGHDLPLGAHELAELVGDQRARRLGDQSLLVFSLLATWFAEKGLTLVDAKFEFGLDGRALVLADEIATPDAARIVAGDLGAAPQWLDKQLLRDWLVAEGFRGEGPPPPLPSELVAELRGRYVAVYETLTGRSFAEWPGSDDPYGGEPV